MQDILVEDLNQNHIAEILKDAIAERIEEMEAQMLEMPQVSIPVQSNNINGMYTREIMIPKGTLLTGAVHLFDYVDIMLSGDITVATEDGPVRYTGANVLHGKAGRKRAGWANEDTRWITVHRTDISDGDIFVKTLTVKTMKDYLMIGVDKCQ